MIQTCRKCGTRVNEVMAFSKDWRKKYTKCPNCYSTTKPKVANEHDIESFLEIFSKKVKDIF